MNFTFKDIPAKENRQVTLEAGSRYQDAKITNENKDAQSNIFVEQYTIADKTNSQIAKDVQSDSSKALGALFDKIDNGDGIVDESELEILEFLTNQFDINNDSLTSNVEIARLVLYDDIDKTKDMFTMLDSFKNGINEENCAIFNTINEDNVLDIMHAYKQLYDENIETDIKNAPISEELKKNIVDLLTQTTEKAYNYCSDFQAESKIENEYYTGKSYDIVQTGDTMEITDKETGEKTTVDLEKMCENLPIEQKIKVKQAMQTIPAELIIDMNNEANLKTTDAYGKTRSAYSSAFDSILLSEKFDKHAYDGARYTFAHETGHALDYSTFYKNYNSSFCQNNEDINGLYQEELKKYIESGNEKYEEVKNENGGYTKISGTDHETYVTWNIKEMFAESYSMLMLGKAPSQECILEYFPQTFEAIKEHLEDIRNAGQQNKKDETGPLLEYSPIKMAT